jgi:hypothetical protein
MNIHLATPKMSVLLLAKGKRICQQLTKEKVVVLVDSMGRNAV